MCKDSKTLFCRILTFLRVIDEHDDKISLTNLALIIVMYKIFKSTDTSITDLGGLMVALMGYNYKKFINKDAINQASKIVNSVTLAADKLTNSTEEDKSKENK